MPPRAQPAPEAEFENTYGGTTHNIYGMCAMRHMYEYGTTCEQLAWIKVAASHHAQWNPHAMLREVVTVEDVLNSPMIADPLHRLDCCVITDGGGALIVTTPEIAKSLKRPLVKVIGAGEAPRDRAAARTSTSPIPPPSGPARGVRGSRRHAVRHQIRLDLRQLHHHGADAARGPRLLQERRGRQVRRRRQPDLGRRQAAVQHRRRRPCNNHPANRGGITKIIEAVRQLRGEAHPKVQVPNCDLAIAHGTGGCSARATARHLHHGAGVMARAT